MTFDLGAGDRGNMLFKVPDIKSDLCFILVSTIASSDDLYNHRRLWFVLTKKGSIQTVAYTLTSSTKILPLNGLYNILELDYNTLDANRADRC